MSHILAIRRYTRFLRREAACDQAMRACISGVLFTSLACGSTTPVQSPPPDTTAAPLAGAVAVTVEGGVRYQTMDGFGTSQRLWDDPHTCEKGLPRCSVPVDAQERILADLYQRLGLTRVRMIVEGAEPVNDNGDPRVTDMSRFNFTGRGSDGLVAYCQQAKRFGLEECFPVVGEEAWMDPRDMNVLMDEYVERTVAVLRRWRQLGLEPRYLSVKNEPQYERPDIWTPTVMRTVVERLGARMRAEGLATMLVVPDELNPALALPLASAVVGSGTARPFVAALATHLYGGTDVSGLRALAQAQGLPLWMTEFSTGGRNTFDQSLDWTRDIVHRLVVQESASAVDYMWGWFGDYDCCQLISVTYDAAARYVSHAPRPMYYLLGHYARHVRPGAQRLEARTTAPGLHVSAFRHPGTGGVTVVMINAGAAELPVGLSMRDLTVTGFPTVYQTTAAAQWRDLGAVGRSSDGGFYVKAPGRSITTLTTR